jgi:CRP/FNR family transcriptional regulator, cyclic AMP receptor protein
MSESSSPPDLMQQLSTHPFIKGLPPDDVESLAALVRTEEFEPLEVLFMSGTDADTFYLIRTGVVSLRVDTGRTKARRVQTISEGSALGWSWLFPPFVWQFDAIAQTPVRCFAFDAAALREKFDEDPRCGYHVMGRVAEIMAERLQATRRQMHSLARR